MTLETCGKVLRFLRIVYFFALDDDKFCILNLSPSFPAETECEQKGKEKL